MMPKQRHLAGLVATTRDSKIFRAERLMPSLWSNGPDDRYAAHSHTYHKVLYCASGSIRFTLEDTG
jgi:quercetin dioxygenase-like cupin family protein